MQKYHEIFLFMISNSKYIIGYDILFESQRKTKCNTSFNCLIINRQYTFYSCVCCQVSMAYFKTSKDVAWSSTSYDCCKHLREILFELHIDRFYRNIYSYASTMQQVVWCNNCQHNAVALFQHLDYLLQYNFAYRGKIKQYL